MEDRDFERTLHVKASRLEAACRAAGARESHEGGLGLVGQAGEASESPEREEHTTMAVARKVMAEYRDDLEALAKSEADDALARIAVVELRAANAILERRLARALETIEDLRGAR